MVDPVQDKLRDFYTGGETQIAINKWINNISENSGTPWRSSDISELRATINQEIAKSDNPNESQLQLQAYLNEAESGVREMAAQGMTFNLADEIKSIGSRYPSDFYLAVENDAMDTYKRLNPVKSAGSQIGGAFLPMVATVAANQVAKKFPFIPKVPLYIPPGVQVVKDAVVATTRKLTKKLNPFQSGIAKSGVYGTAYSMGDDEGSIKERALKMKPYVAGVTSLVLSIPSNLVTQRIFSSLADRISKFPSKDRGEEIAYDMVIEAMENDAGTIEEALVQAVNAMNKGRSLTVADVSTSSADLLDMVNMIPSKLTKQSRQVLQDRQSGRFGRLQTDLQNAFGAEAGYYETIKLLQEARSADSAGMYEAANINAETGEDRMVGLNDEYMINISGEDKPMTLNKLMQRPVMKDAYLRGSRIAANKGIVLPNVEFTPEGMVILEGENKGLGIDAFNFEFLHYMKEGLDDLISTANNPLATESSAGRTELRGFMENKNAFLQILDTNPEYKAAREVFAGHMATADALEMGKNIFNKSYTKNIDLTEMVAAYGPSEKEAFTNGVYHGLDEKLAETSEKQNYAGKLLYTPRTRSLMKLAFDGSEKDFNLFMDNMVTEADARALENKVLTGAQTAGRTSMKEKYQSKTKRALFLTDLDNFDKALRFAINADFELLTEQQDIEFADTVKRILTATEQDRLQQELTRGHTLGEAWVRAGAAPKLAAFFKGLSEIDGSPYVIGDIASQLTDFAESSSMVDFDKYDKKIKNTFNNLMKKESLDSASLDNFDRTVPSSVSEKVRPVNKESLASQLDTMLANVSQSNMPLVSPANAVTPQAQISETVLPNPKDRELAERLRANNSGIGGLA